LCSFVLVVRTHRKQDAFFTQTSVRFKTFATNWFSSRK